MKIVLKSVFIIAIVVVAMIGVMVPSVFADEIGLDCPNVSPTSNYEMVFECNKKIDVNIGVLESMFDDINFVSGLFPEAKLHNIIQNDNGGTATMGIDFKVITLKSEIEFVKRSSDYRIDFLTGKLAGSQMIIATSPTSGFDGTSDMGTDVSLTFKMKKKMCVSLIFKICAEPDMVMGALDKGLFVLEPQGKKIQKENPEFIILPTTETDVIPNDISPPKTSIINKETFEKLKEDPEVIKVAKEFDSQPKKKYFPEPVVTLKIPEPKNYNDEWEFDAVIELNHVVYTPTDKVHMLIVAPNFNQDSNVIDTIGDDDFSTLTISTDRNYLSNYKLIESGIDTGIFIGEIILVADNYPSGVGPEGGKLSAYPGDTLQLLFETARFDVMVYASIEATIGEIMWLESSYGTDDTATIRVIDPDMNRNPDVKDTVMVKTYSNSDFEGKLVKLTEVGDAWGIFEGVVSFSSTPEGGKLLVSPNDILIAEFEDTIMPQPYYKTDSLTVIAESKITNDHLQLIAEIRDCSSGSYSDLCKESEYVIWDENKPLVWDDFQGVPGTVPDDHDSTLSIDDTGVRTFYAIDWYVWWEKSNSTPCEYKITKLDVVALTSKIESWVYSDRIDGEEDEILKHEQGHFDITQIHAQQFQAGYEGKTFACPSGIYDDDEIFNEIDGFWLQIEDDWFAMEKTYDIETDHHEDIEAQAEWNKKIKSLLSTGEYVKETSIPKPTEEQTIEEGGGCLIATATYGSEMAPQVQQLRELRDNTLLNTQSGTKFMGMFNEIYYSFSPVMADMQRENPVFKEMVKLAITPMISSLSILNYVDLNSESEVLGYGISLIILNLGMYLGVPAIVVIGIKRKF